MFSFSDPATKSLKHNYDKGSNPNSAGLDAVRSIFGLRPTDGRDNNI
jgi:hypothetical protein